MTDIKIVNASAGTGKTYTLTEDICSKAQSKSVEKIIATTFTNKAASELKSKIRKKLLQQGFFEQAEQILTGNIGTVNAVFGKIVSDNAFDLGISPQTGIIEDEQRASLFNKATADIRNKYSEQAGFMKAVKRFNMEKSWFEDVVAVCEKCRQNAGTDIEAGKKASFDFFDRLLPAQGDARRIKENMYQALLSLQGLSKVNKAVMDLMERSDDIDVWSWEDWITANGQSGEKYEYLSETAANFLSLPQLREDLRKIIDTVFDCAGECLSAYQLIKKDLGVIDFIDQEGQALELFHQKNTTSCERFDTLYVDEFQDTSPLQMALFSNMLQRSDVMSGVYVGDPKQSIYKFRGTDPLLINEINKKATSHQTLKKSYRTVEPIVKFINRLFLDKFQKAGLSPEQILTNETQRHEKIFKDPVVVWKSIYSKQSDHNEAVARKIKELLDSHHLVFDAEEKKLRPVRGSDIAVFFQTNSHITDFAKTAGQYFKVSSSSGSLFESETCILLMSALSLLIDKEDTLAKAQILKLSGVFDPTSPDNDHECFDDLDELRFQRVYLSPCEVVDRLLGLPFVQRYFSRCGNSAAAYGEAESFRGLVQAYEDDCINMVKPATLENMLSTFEQKRDDEKFAPNPPSLDKDAVTVLSYHKAKGLEWPVTVCMDCHLYETEYDKDLFTIHVFTAGEFNPENPLENREILYLPWGVSVKGSFESLLEQYEPAQRLLEQARQEYDRLMYVGLTRARDCLILHNAIKSLKSGEKDTFYCRGKCDHIAQVVLTAKDVVQADFSTKSVEMIEVTKSKKVYSEPFVVNPSRNCVPAKNEPHRIIDLPVLKETIGAVQVTSGLGTLFHAVMGQNKPDENLIKKIVEQFDRTLVPVAVEMKKRFDEEIVKVTGKAEMLAEWPVTVEIGDRLFRGIVDMIALQEDGFYIVDHKILDYDNPQKTVEVYADELWRYARAVGKLTKKKCKGCILHCPLQNKLIMFAGQSDHI